MRRTQMNQDVSNPSRNPMLDPSEAAYLAFSKATGVVEKYKQLIMMHQKLGVPLRDDERVDETLIAALVELKAINEPVFSGRTILTQCIRSADYEGARMALRSGASPNKKAGTGGEGLMHPVLFLLYEYESIKYDTRSVQTKSILRQLSCQMLDCGAVVKVEYQTHAGYKRFTVDTEGFWANKEAQVLEKALDNPNQEPVEKVKQELNIRTQSPRRNRTRI